MKKIVKTCALIIAILMTIVVFASCTTASDDVVTSDASVSTEENATSEPQTTSDEEDEEYEIAYIARALSDSGAAWLAEAIEMSVADYPDINLTVFDGQSNNEMMAQHIENAVTKGYDLILLQVLDSEAQVAPAAAAMDAGVNLVTVNNRLNDDDRAPKVDVDPYEQSAVIARLAVDEVPQDANVVVLDGPAGNLHSDQRRLGWQEEFFDKRPDVTILDEQIANWNKDEAMIYMEDWVQAYPQIDAIISMNDNMCTGALEVVTTANLFPDILAYGVDGTAEACLLIQEGTMTYTTLQNMYTIADKALKLCHDILTGVTPDDGTLSENQIFDETPLVTKDNVDEYIQLHKEAGMLK